jgi:ubiquitin carboxyl-terminal hydrolase 47
MEEREKLTVNVDTQILDYLKQGDFVYELYSILIHSGSAFGGHYYAYIKSFDDGKWYKFNDTEVKEISTSEIPTVFGDKNGCTTAYMLKYRQYDPDTKVNPIRIPDDMIPSYLKTQIDEEKDILLKEQLDIEERLLALKLMIHWNG